MNPTTTEQCEYLYDARSSDERRERRREGGRVNAGEHERSPAADDRHDEEVVEEAFVTTD